jgi:hypothetical protein
MTLAELSPKHESRMKNSSIKVFRMATPCSPPPCIQAYMRGAKVRPLIPLAAGFGFIGLAS